MTIKIGDRVEVLPHIQYQHLQHGAVISPMIAHERPGYTTTIRAIWRDELEDEHGNPVVEYTYETADGKQYSRDQLRLLA